MQILGAAITRQRDIGGAARIEVMLNPDGRLWVDRLKAGDLIVKIDEKPTKGLALNDAVKLMRFSAS